ncbi:MAG: ABC-F family ATP-binding cassette domain-containing protein [Chitinophagaceae bacterium]|nr:ABC-F family ATP-binding cassette domain-containing protein [Oligoflexus sp.]
MLAIENLYKNFGSRTVLDHVNYRFPDGEKIALVGSNGAGKTTLLNILCGQEPIDGGRILSSQGLRLGYLPQEPEANPASTVLEECVAGHRTLSVLKRQMDAELILLETDSSDERISAFEKAESLYNQAGGYSLDSRASSILGGLGFSDEICAADPRSLSGGWRMRLELAKVFLNEPDVLILDEPTNHLDLPSLVWVERYLQSFRGTLLFVSHDRALLNRLASMTLYLSHGELRPYKGNFDAMLEQRAIESEQLESRRANLETQREHLESFVERFGAKASKATQAQSKAKQIERIRALESDIRVVATEQNLVFKLPPAPSCGRDILRIKDLSIGYQSTLASGIELLVEKQARIAIIGSNGIGKSTFLKTIAGQIPARQGSFEFGYNVKPAYFAQNQEETLRFEETILTNVLDVRSDLGEKDARRILGSFLFSGDDVFKPIKVLSGGEKARVALCRSLVQQANFLVLDEPTNHLDMTSVEVLIEGMKSYDGTLLFVSHDRNFIDSLATHIFVMLPDGRSQLFIGQLDDYQSMAAKLNFPNVLAPSKEMSKGSTAKDKEREKEKQKERDQKEREKPTFVVNEEDVKNLKRERTRLQKLIEKLEKDQAPLKSAIQKLEDKLAKVNPSAYSEAQKINDEVKVFQRQLETNEEQWLEAAAGLEQTEIRLSEMGRLR